MFFKFGMRNLLAHRFSPRITAANASHRYLYRNPLCTTVESPDLPPWLKFSDTPTPSHAELDDDFVIPSLANWVDSHILTSKPKLPAQTSKQNSLDQVDAVSTLLKKPYSSPELVGEALNGRGFQPSSDLVSQVLKRFSNCWVSALGFFKWAKAQTGYRHSPEVYNLMVDILGKCRTFDLMWDLVKEMSQLEGYVTLDTMSKVMRRLAKARKHEDAIEAFRRMGLFGVKQDTAALNVLMDALVKGDSVEHAHKVVLEFKSRIPLSSHSFNILIHGWCKARNFDNARKAMEDMKGQGFEPDVFSYTNFIEAYCHEKDFRKVDQVLEEMRANGCTPNAVTYTTVMINLGKAGQVSEALEVYEKMKSDGCLADTPFYSCLIFILGRAGRLKDARDVFEDMPKQGVVRDVVTYNTMISTACAHSREETALRLLKEMEDGSCKPNVETYHRLLKMCCRKKRMKVLKFLLDHMLKNDISLDLATYSLLVSGLCKSGRVEDAYSFLEEMVSQGMTPKPNTLKLLIGELESKSMSEEKERVEKLMDRFSQKGNV
ncbi:pentatricopeptide repeat-containing protein At3g22670, mitochondrial [Vigna radiata var. radiata]|uniref:Pentatricopeptide repeat-containing protein At3g22670, mitochondrial n=1 Tax=Vigna radiata var. radiata TaxID=3916 RepID=A0A1S3VML8_VIGRR|nr:pentatricopeptide repeat-containing protein At3g22670, mitochondrial [Vigna radiata var. radiata]